MTFDFSNILANANPAGANPAASQAISRAQALFKQTQQQYGLKGNIGVMGNTGPQLNAAQGLGTANMLANPNPAGANSAASQAIGRSRALFNQTQQQYGLNVGNFRAPGNAAQGLGMAKELFPTLGGIPGGSNIGNTNVNLGALNNTILNLRKQYGGKIPGKGTAQENLQAMLNSANEPLTPEQALLNSFAFMKNQVDTMHESFIKPDEELARIQDEIDAIKSGGGEGVA